MLEQPPDDGSHRFGAVATAVLFEGDRVPDLGHGELVVEVDRHIADDSVGGPIDHGQLVPLARLRAAHRCEVVHPLLRLRQRERHAPALVAGHVGVTADLGEAFGVGRGVGADHQTLGEDR